MLLQDCKLTYFDLSGRGEAARLALVLGKVKFTDDRISFKDFKDLKPTLPWGSLPILTLSDGTVIAQQRAIIRLVGKETGFYPSDSLQAAKADELMDGTEDFYSTTTKVGQGLEKEAKEAARMTACQEGGAIHALLTKVDNVIAANDKSDFGVGDSLTVADLFVYCTVNNLVSGFFDGIPSDAIDGFDGLTKLRKAVRSNPTVCEWYDNLDSSIDMPASYGPL